MARAIHASGGKAPGFGHPVHRPLDPRAERILELADARGVSGPHTLLARLFRDAVAAAWEKPLTMNVAMPIAAVLLDLGFAPATVKSIPLLARTAGLLAHLAEERELPVGFFMAGQAEGRSRTCGRRTGTGDARPRRRVASVGRAARDRRRELSRADRLPLRALGLLSREAARGGCLERRGGRRPRGHRRAASHREARAQGDEHAGQSVRRPPLRRARRDRAHLLDERHDGDAELHPADRGRPRELGDGFGTELRGVRRRRRRALRLDVQRRSVRRGRCAHRVRSRRPLPHPGRHREHRSADACDRAPAADGGGVHAVVCGLRDRVGGGARPRPPRLERQARARRGRAGGRRAGLPGAARGGLGREGHGGDGHRRHRPVALGRVRGAGRHAPRRARLRARRADRPRDGQRRRAGRRRHGRARADPSAASRCAAPALPHARPRARPHEPLSVRAHRSARALHRADRRHADRPGRQRVPVRRARGGQRVHAAGQRQHPRPARDAGGQAGAAAARERRARTRCGPPTPRLRTTIRDRLRSVLVVQTRIELVPWGSLERSEYKSKLVDH